MGFFEGFADEMMKISSKSIRQSKSSSKQQGEESSSNASSKEQTEESTQSADGGWTDSQT